MVNVGRRRMNDVYKQEQWEMTEERETWCQIHKSLSLKLVIMKKKHNICKVKRVLEVLWVLDDTRMGGDYFFQCRFYFHKHYFLGILLKQE